MKSSCILPNVPLSSGSLLIEMKRTFLCIVLGGCASLLAEEQQQRMISKQVTQLMSAKGMNYLIEPKIFVKEKNPTLLDNRP